MNGQKKTLPTEIRRILVLQIGPIGDTLFAIPALRALRRSFPAATIAVLASPRAGDVLRGAPFIDLLRVCPSGLDLFRAVLEFRQMEFDLAVGLSNQGSWLAPLCGTPLKAGFPSPLLALAEPGAIKEAPSAHVVEHCLAVVRMLGAAAGEECRDLEIWLAAGERERSESYLAAHHLKEPIVALHAGGRYFQFKRWPIRRYAELADGLAELGACTVMVGGPEDIELSSIIARSARSSPVLAVGILRLKETAALLSRCQLFIGNDSAPLHLAAAVKTPTIGLFGPTSPAQFSPFGSGHTVIYKAFPCSPCFRFLGGLWQYWPKCPRAYCMEAISVREVLGTARDKLAYRAKEERG